MMRLLSCCQLYLLNFVILQLIRMISVAKELLSASARVTFHERLSEFWVVLSVKLVQVLYLFVVSAVLAPFNHKI